MSLPFRTLGLGGGGIKGILHIGALLELSKRQPLIFPEGIYGCSIGSIIATYIAFELPLDKIVQLMNDYLNMDNITPKFQFHHLSSAFSAKGLFSMTEFELRIAELFRNAGLELIDKKIGDSKMPLFIVSSNITKGIPTIFSNEVSLIDAIKCSCCIPGVFRPIELYGQLYVDGTLFVPCIASVMPKTSDTLILSLTKQRKRAITPSLIENMSPLDYLDELYTMTSHLFHDACMTENTLCLSYPNLTSSSDLKEFNTEHILQLTGLSFNKFISKSLL